MPEGRDPNRERTFFFFLFPFFFWFSRSCPLEGRGHPNVALAPRFYSCVASFFPLLFVSFHFLFFSSMSLFNDGGEV